jgi:hypothetical protein
MLGDLLFLCSIAQMIPLIIAAHSTMGDHSETALAEHAIQEMSVMMNSVVDELQLSFLISSVTLATQFVES